MKISFHLIYLFLLLTLKASCGSFFTQQPSVNQDSLNIVLDIQKAISLYNSNTDSSEILLKKAISESRKNNLNKLNFNAKLNLSRCFEIQDKFDKSDSLLQSLKKEISLRGDKKQEIQFNIRFSNYVNNIGFIDSALTILNETEIISKANNDFKLNEIYKRIAGIYHNSGQLDSALHYLLVLKEKIPVSDTFEIIDLDCRIGMIYENLVYTQKSLEYYFEAFKLSEAAGQTNIDVLYGMGMGNFQLENYDTAFHYFQQVIDECGENWTYRFVPLNSYMHLWRCSVILGKSNARKIGMNFIAETNPILNTERKGYIGIMQAEIYMHYNYLKEAELVLLDCLHFMEKIEKSGLVTDHYSRLSEVYEKQGNFEKALYYHKLFKETFDEERSSEIQKRIVQLEEKYEAAEKEARITKLTSQFENEKLNAQLSKSRYQFIFVLLIIFLAMIGALGLYLRNRQKMNILKLKSENTAKEHQIQNILEQSKTKILKSSLEGQERERTRLAKELHDDLSGQVSALRYFVASKKGIFIGEDESLLRNELSKFQYYIRNLSHQMAKPRFTNIELPQLIAEQKYWTNNNDIEFYFDFDNKINWALVPENHQNEMYRIVQESVSNTLKHSGAKTITIKIEKESDKIYLEVCDNGKGFQNGNHLGFGIKNMKERARLIGANLKIETAYLSGTKVSLIYSFS